MQAVLARIAVLAVAQRSAPAAMDSTGLSTTTASAHYQSRAGKTHRRYVKVSAIVQCGTLLPLALVLDHGPSNDRVQAPELLRQAQAAGPVERLYADAGYDAELIQRPVPGGVGRGKPDQAHPPSDRRAPGRPLAGGNESRTPESTALRTTVISRSYFSGLKRTTGSSLSARSSRQQLAEAALRR